jgi:hypothetical protein
MSDRATMVSTSDISRLIRSIRGQRVILDSDLAKIYGVETRALNQAVKRNQDRFPADFMFELSQEESLGVSQSMPSEPDPASSPLRSQIVISKEGRGGRRYLPCAFTEHGALMAATVLSSARAVTMSLYIIRAFVKMREDLAANTAILKRLAEIDKSLLLHDGALRDIYQRLRPLLEPPPPPAKPEIGFHVKEDSVAYRVRRKPARIT